jgi:hypothetical protein
MRQTMPTPTFEGNPICAHAGGHAIGGAAVDSCRVRRGAPSDARALAWVDGLLARPYAEQEPMPDAHDWMGPAGLASDGEQRLHHGAALSSGRG